MLLLLHLCCFRLLGDSLVVGFMRLYICLVVGFCCYVPHVILRFLVLPSYYEVQNDYANHTETIILCNRCVCNWKQIPRECLRVLGHSQKYLVEAPELHNQQPCVTDVLWNLETNSQIMKNVCNNLGPMVGFGLRQPFSTEMRKVATTKLYLRRLDGET